MSAKVVHMTSIHVIEDPRIFRKECTTLARAGHDVTLVAAHDGAVPSGPVRIVTVPHPRSRLERLTLTAFRVFRAALRERGDVYHLHDPELLPWGQVLRVMGKRVIFDMHENHAVDSTAREWRHPRLGRAIAWLFRHVEPALLSGLQVVYAEDSYAAHYPRVSRSVVVRNMPVLSDLLSIQEPKNEVFTLGYLGAVTRDRGTVTTLRAMKILKDRGHTVAFECLGPISDEHRAELESLIRDLGLGGISIPGRVEPLIGWRRMARCHVGLAVLRARPNYFESYPTKLFEYMALGLPVIVSDFPLYRSVIGSPPCGVTVDPDDPGALANAIETMIRDRVVAEALAACGKRVVQERFSWSGEGEKLLGFYDEILSS